MSSLSLHVVFARFLWVLLLLAGFSSVAQRQKTGSTPRVGSSIVDDSTRNVYGPATTLWTTEKDLFENRPNYRPLDTLIHNYHRWTYVQRFNNYYKDLGVMGTALSSIFPMVPSTIGASSGFQVYEPYFTSEEPQYFDTKSPFTRMYIVWGGVGRATTRVEFSRNINPRWNFGFNYRPILVDKQIQRSGKGDRQTISHYYDFYTTYTAKDKRYSLLFNFRRIRHRVNENGGVVSQSSGPFKDYFDPNALPYLVAAQSEEYRRTIHLLHQYQLAKPFQVYHMADFTKQTNAFRDDSTRDSNRYFDHLEVDSLKANDQTTFITMQQEAGIKGNASKLFYSAFYRFRTYDYSNPYLTGYPLPKSTSGVENYLGGRISLRLDSLYEVSGLAEYMLEGYYRIEGQIQSPWLEGYFKNALSKPGYMQMMYRGSHDYWSQSFVGTNSTQAQGFLKFNSRLIQFWGGGTFTLLHNYLYFKEEDPVDPANTQRVLPFQSSGNQSTFAPEVKMTIRFFNHIRVRPQVIYTTFIVNDDHALRIPTVFVNAQLTYDNELFNRHLQLQAGADFHWKSGYQALGYDPAIQQFYVPIYNTTGAVSAPAYPLVDIFVTGKMRRARFFFKYHNLVQLFTQSGYLPTPGYPGQRSVLDFGFDFLLFD